jgi:hypothetical protein
MFHSVALMSASDDFIEVLTFSRKRTIQNSLEFAEQNVNMTFIGFFSCFKK